MKATPTGVWFDVGPEQVHPDLKCSALSIKSDSPMYDPDQHHEGQMLQAYVFPKNLEETLSKDTGLRIIEADHHYTLQVHVDVSEMEFVNLFNIRRKLEKFVDKHFNPYDPDKDFKK